MTVSTLRPGLIVSLKTGAKGNVFYSKKIIQQEHKTKQGESKAAWETVRTISDPAEYELAHKARTKARALISAVCTHTAFGLLCPEADEEVLNKAIAEARQVADEFNATAQLSRVYVYVITGRVAPDDVEAVRAINSEVRDLLKAMQDGIVNLDVAAVREAAGKAKELGSMLSPDATVRIQMAIDAARGAARQIVKAGETASAEIDQVAIRKITEARTSFLDLDPVGVVATPKATVRAIDLVPAQKGK